MENVTIPNDIKVFYVTATSFPDGIMAAHQQLYALVPPTGNRKYFGLSRPENGAIVYRAAAEELHDGEAAQYHCSAMVIKKGNYISMLIKDFMKQPQNIGAAFHQLLSHPGKDPEGYCVECYLNENDVNCMVRLKD